MALSVQQFLAKKSITEMEHPPCSPHMALNDFCMLKKREKYFTILNTSTQKKKKEKKEKKEKKRKKKKEKKRKKERKKKSDNGTASYPPTGVP
jgi:hypothetical protein